MKNENRLLRGALLAALTAASVMAPAMAQDPADDAVGVNDTATVDRDDDDGFDWGLLGLLGLRGVLGRKRHDVVVRDRDPFNPNRV